VERKKGGISVKNKRKLVVAAIGVALLVLKDMFEVDLGYTPDQVFNVVVGILTSFGVYQVRNG